MVVVLVVVSISRRPFGGAEVVVPEAAWPSEALA